MNPSGLCQCQLESCSDFQHIIKPQDNISTCSHKRSIVSNDVGSLSTIIFFLCLRCWWLKCLSDESEKNGIPQGFVLGPGRFITHEISMFRSSELVTGFRSAQLPWILKHWFTYFMTSRWVSPIILCNVWTSESVKYIPHRYVSSSFIKSITITILVWLNTFSTSLFSWSGE